MGSPGPAEKAPRPSSRGRVALQAVRRALPPSRLVWIALVVLGIYSVITLHGLGATPLLVVPLIAVLTDLAFARVRFERLRVPDTAIVTGLFVALILPPTAPLLFSATAAFVAVAIRHVLRSGGRPWFNPATVGLLMGALVFGLAPAWWAGVGTYGEYLTIALGLVLIGLGASRWRLPATFLLAYGLLAGLQHVLLGATTDPRILLLQAIDPTTIFFALFMVAEPRTAPAEPHGQVLYAGVVGVVAAFAPIAFPTLGLLLALVAGNGLALWLRRLASHSASVPERSSRSRPQRTSTPSRRSPIRWPIGYRVSAGLLVLVILGGVASSLPSSHQAVLIVAGSAPSGGSLTGCTTDNPSISSSTLSQLHSMLGPSVIRSYNPSTGVVVFYDPVNKVTVTETDIYEDYGFAEFNGDDFAVSGCS